MRVGRSVAVAGEMFNRSHHSIGAGAANVRGYEIADLLRIFAKRSGIDDRIRWIRVDVGVRKEIPVHTDGASFLRGYAAESLGVIQFARGPECHGMGKFGGAAQTHADSTLEISRNQ